MKERSQKVEGQGSALLSVSELQQFRACAMELAPVSPTRAGGGVQVLYAGVQWVRHDTIHHPYHAVCLGTNPGRGYSQKALFPRSVYLFVFIRKGRALGNEWLRDPSALHICVWSGSQDAGTLRLCGDVFWCMLLAARVP